MLPAFPFSWPLTPKFSPSLFTTLTGTRPTATRPKSCATHLLSLLHHQHKTQRYVSFSQKGGVPKGTFTPTRYTYINAHCSLFSDSITQPATFNFFFSWGINNIESEHIWGCFKILDEHGATYKLANADLRVWVCALFVIL